MCTARICVGKCFLHALSVNTNERTNEAPEYKCQDNCTGSSYTYVNTRYYLFHALKMISFELNGV